MKRLSFTDRELAEMGLMIDPLDPNSLVRVEDACGRRPDDSWTTEQLQHYVVAAMDRAKAFVCQAGKLREEIHSLVRQTAFERWWIGCALHLVKGRLGTKREWTGWQRRQRVSRTTVWRAVRLYQTYESPELVRELPIVDVYRALKMCPAKTVAEAVDTREEEQVREDEEGVEAVQPRNESDGNAQQTNGALSIEQRANLLRDGKHSPAHGIVLTPPLVARFLYDLLSPLRPKIVMDVASGNGDLSRPWRDSAQVIEYELAFGRDFFQCPDHLEADLVLCNPPFGQEKEFLRRIIEVVPETCPVALFVTHRVRLGSYASSRDWRWCRDAWPPITSIISLPRGVFKGVNEPIEVLVFRAPHLLPHYFLPGGVGTTDACRPLAFQEFCATTGESRGIDEMANTSSAAVC